METATDQPAQSYLKGFNWGAFWLTFVWGAAHRLWLTLLVLLLLPFQLLASIKIIFWIAGLGFGVWFGLRGNEWAWKTRGNRDPATFMRREKVWATAGWIIGLIAWGLFAYSQFMLNTQPSVESLPGVTLEINGVEQ